MKLHLNDLQDLTPESFKNLLVELENAKNDCQFYGNGNFFVRVTNLLGSDYPLQEDEMSLERIDFLILEVKSRM